MNLKEFFRSKKAKAMMLGVLVAILVPLGLDPEVAEKVANMVMMYIGGQSAVDTGKAFKKEAP